MPTNSSSPMNYTTLQTYLETILIDQAPSADFTTILPAAIQDAEQRIYRDMDFVNTRTIDSTGALTAGNRQFTLPTDQVVFLVVQGVSLMAVGGSFGVTKATPLEPVSLDDIDFTWPDPTVQKFPNKWAMLNDAAIVVGATPDQAYPVSITGTFRPSSMSSQNTTTYIGNIYPDLLVAACMMFLTGYQRDFGAQSDDPKMAMSWENVYQDRLKSAKAEEVRRKGEGVNWAASPTPMAVPQPAGG